MKPSKSNDFAIHIFHGHIYSFICNVVFILRFSQVWACDTVFLFALHVSSHFVALFLHGGGVKGRGHVQQAWSRHHHWGWSQGTGACTTGLIQAPSLGVESRDGGVYNRPDPGTIIGGGVKGRGRVQHAWSRHHHWGWSQGTGACTTGLIQAPSLGVESRDRGVYNMPDHASLDVMSLTTTDPGTIIGGGVKGQGRVQHAWPRLPRREVIDHNWSRHHHWAEACGWIGFIH